MRMLSQGQLSAKAKLSTKTISDIELGKRLASFETLEVLASHLSISFKDLFDWTESRFVPHMTWDEQDAAREEKRRLKVERQKAREGKDRGNSAR